MSVNEAGVLMWKPQCCDRTRGCVRDSKSFFARYVARGVVNREKQPFRRCHGGVVHFPPPAAVSLPRFLYKKDYKIEQARSPCRGVQTDALFGLFWTISVTFGGHFLGWGGQSGILGL